MFGKLSLIRRLSRLGTILKTSLYGERVGEDCFGNHYFRARSQNSAGREDRWVLYCGEPEASLVPPAWFGWLHHMCDHPLPNDGENRYVWQKPHQPNLSGTGAAPLPAGHPLASWEDDLRARAQGLYQAWKPSE